ncbi:LPXTG cell wall anchor domain-containing protein [Amygdalobacter nucleatus]|nr:LPXTG cell wall anchor domain-containing protein [Amygdalobacter nucleatus]MDF0486069.1 LPXTG cell wall anchor domain-containing protein [Amygdalobacter nucleatus]
MAKTGELVSSVSELGLTILALASLYVTKKRQH